MRGQDEELKDPYRAAANPRSMMLAPQAKRIRPHFIRNRPIRFACNAVSRFAIVLSRYELGIKEIV